MECVRSSKYFIIYVGRTSPSLFYLVSMFTDNPLNNLGEDEHATSRVPKTRHAGIVPRQITVANQTDL